MKKKKSKWAKWLLGIVVAIPLASIVAVAAMSRGPVPITMFMIHRAVETWMDDQPYTWQYQWVDYDKINPALTRAVMASEDNLFPTHHGFSQKGLEKAWKERCEKGHVKHGGSTISQQTAKNVFTSGRRTYIRKACETWYTVLIEIFWSKKRIMEVYLNVIEMGNGVYGAEAASQKYFHHSAKRLTSSESALIAASLPRPRKYSVTNPGPYMLNRQQQILNLMPKLGPIEL